MSDWVVVGAEVIERHASSWKPFVSYGAVKKIAKVYKNGNFIVEGSTQQWDARYGSHASKTGQRDYYRNGTDLVPHTAEVRAEIELAAKYEGAVDVVKSESERLENVWRARDVDETIAEAARIIDAAEGRS